MFLFQILPDGDTTKPQAKHLQTRADFLLKVLRRNMDGPKVKAEVIKILEIFNLNPKK